MQKYGIISQWSLSVQALFELECRERNITVPKSRIVFRLKFKLADAATVNKRAALPQSNERFLKMEKKEIYADGIGQIHFAGNMVRFDFITVQPGEDGAAPATQSNVRVIMPPQGFLNAMGSMQQLIDKLVEAGVLRKNENVAE